MAQDTNLQVVVVVDGKDIRSHSDDRDPERPSCREMQEANNADGPQLKTTRRQTQSVDTTPQYRLKLHWHPPARGHVVRDGSWP